MSAQTKHTPAPINFDFNDEAFAVFNETGLTPRELADQRHDLLWALKKISEGREFPRTIARSAIARAQGGAV